MPDPIDAAAALAAALASEGLRASVHAEGRLALVSADAELFARADARGVAGRLARGVGFTHVALLLDDGDAPDASLAAGRVADGSRIAAVPADAPG